jgi:hypothetical protein
VPTPLSTSHTAHPTGPADETEICPQKPRKRNSHPCFPAGIREPGISTCTPLPKAVLWEGRPPRRAGGWLQCPKPPPITESFYEAGASCPRTHLPTVVPLSPSMSHLGPPTASSTVFPLTLPHDIWATGQLWHPSRGPGLNPYSKAPSLNAFCSSSPPQGFSL